MPAISTVRAAIVDGLDGTVRAYAYSPENLNPPCAVVGFPTSYDPNDTLGDTAMMVIPVNLYVPYSTNRGAEDALEALLATSGTGSVIDAIEDCGSNFAVQTIRDFGVLENSAGAPVALGCTIEVIVYA